MEREEIMMLCLAAFLIFCVGIMLIHKEVKAAKQQCTEMIAQHQIEQQESGK